MDADTTSSKFDFHPAPAAERLPLVEAAPLLLLPPPAAAAPPAIVVVVVFLALELLTRRGGRATRS